MIIVTKPILLIWRLLKTSLPFALLTVAWIIYKRLEYDSVELEVIASVMIPLCYIILHLYCVRDDHILFPMSSQNRLL